MTRSRLSRASLEQRPGRCRASRSPVPEGPCRRGRTRAAPRPPTTTTSESRAIAARRCVSRRALSGVTRRFRTPRLGQGVLDAHRARGTGRRRPRRAPSARRTGPRRSRRRRCPRAGSASGRAMPASGSAGRTGTGTTPARETAISAASMTRAPSLPVPPPARKRVVRCSTADCGWSVTSASLSASAPSALDDRSARRAAAGRRR